MDNQAKLLIIEDESIFQDLLTAYFSSNYQLFVAGSGEAGLQQAKATPFDLIILDINLPGMDGYQTCQQLKDDSVTCHVPVLFLSRYQDLKDRLKAYGVGGDDYLSKPFDKDEVTVKVAKILEQKKHRDKLTEDLQYSYEAVLRIQNDSAKIHSISRFLQGNLFCHDLEGLSTLFFKTVKQIDISCVLYIHGEAPFFRSDTGEIHRLEQEILEMASALGRIYSFGRNRAIFNWKNVSVLVRNLGDNIDIFAILMNGLEVSVQAINTERKLLAMLDDLRQQNELIEDNISDLFTQMNCALKETFLSLGFVADLSADEEDRINDQVEAYHSLINGELGRLNTNNNTIAGLVNDLRSPPEGYAEEVLEDVDSSLEALTLF